MPYILFFNWGTCVKFPISIAKCFKSFDFKIGQSKDESNTCPVNNYIEKFLNENVQYLILIVGHNLQRQHF
jgi:hypothetical protein